MRDGLGRRALWLFDLIVFNNNGVKERDTFLCREYTYQYPNSKLSLMQASSVLVCLSALTFGWVGTRTVTVIPEASSHFSLSANRVEGGEFIHRRPPHSHSLTPSEIVYG